MDICLQLWFLVLVASLEYIFNKLLRTTWLFKVGIFYLMHILTKQVIFNLDKSSIQVCLITWRLHFQTEHNKCETCTPTDLLLTNSSWAEHLVCLACSSVNWFRSLSLVSFNILSFSAFSVLYKVKASSNWENKDRRWQSQQIQFRAKTRVEIWIKK